MLNKKTLRTWVEIDKQALVHNYRMWRRLAGPKKKLLAVIKSNAYGHGIVECAKIFSRLGADWLGVDALEEAIILRQNKIKKPILVLGHTRPANFGLAIKNGVTITISSPELLATLIKIDKKLGKNNLNFQLKVDTGMNRQGFSLTDLPAVIEKIKKLKKAKLTGIYSHLAGPCDKEHEARTSKQVEKFEEAVRILVGSGYSNILKHLSATGGTSFNFGPSTNLVRVGLGLYGLWPDQAAVKYLAKKAKWFSLKPALTWKAVVSEIHRAKKGEGVGYSFTHILKRDSRLAICAVGYWHGLGRVLSSRGRVMIYNKMAPILGRVCMDMIIVDVTDIPQANVDDGAIVMGPGIDTYQFAELSNTSVYEVVTRINPDIPRLYI